jgi:hypothetical protein
MGGVAVRCVRHLALLACLCICAPCGGLVRALGFSLPGSARSLSRADWTIVARNLEGTNGRARLARPEQRGGGFLAAAVRAVARAVCGRRQ